MRFAREGYRGTSVADVCRDAGLSTTGSYPYFSNKEAFFVAAVDEDVAGLIDDAVSLVTIDEKPDAWGSGLMQALVEHMPAHPWPGASCGASSRTSRCGCCRSPPSRSCARR